MKRIALRPGAQRLDHRLEALLEVAAEARAGQQPGGVEREDLRILQRLGRVVGQQPDGEPFGHRRLADAGLADKHRVVLAAPAQHFDRALQLDGPADQRIELALPRALGQVRAVRRQRIARRRRSFVAAAGFGATLRPARRRRRPAPSKCRARCTRGCRAA